MALDSSNLPVLKDTTTLPDERRIEKYLGDGTDHVECILRGHLKVFEGCKKKEIPAKFLQQGPITEPLPEVPPPAVAIQRPLQEIRVPVTPPLEQPVGDLVVVQGDALVTTTLALAQGTENDHASVIKLVRTHTLRLEEFGGVRFEIAPFTTPGGIQKREIAFLNEPQATLLLTCMRNNDIVLDFKVRLVKAFYAMKARLSAPQNPYAVMDRRGLLKLALDLEESNLMLTQQVQTLGCEVQAQAEEIVTLKPKGRFHDRVHDAKGLISMGSAAQQLGTGRQRLFNWLRSKKVIQPKSSRPYQHYVDNQVFEVKTVVITAKDGTERPFDKVYLTGSGWTWLQRQWDRHHPQQA